ncbi:MAG TPA: hypothetical protein VK153_02325 [Candidatus Paceibacterota bacterium]|nr:hypothetical protein [Candidatus Paceibacterota bacterium]
MQKIATKIFIIASITFAVLGIIMMFTGGPDKGGIIPQLFFINIFIILSSFALSVAGKYLKS